MKIKFYKFSLTLLFNNWSQNRSAAIMPRLLGEQLWNRDSVTGRSKRIFSSPKMQTNSGGLPVSYLAIECAFHQGTKQPELEVSHSPPAFAEIRNYCNRTSTPHILLFCAQELLQFTLVYFVINTEFFCATSGTGLNGHH
jgi:hypothetical protein